MSYYLLSLYFLFSYFVFQGNNKGQAMRAHGLSRNKRKMCE